MKKFFIPFFALLTIIPVDAQEKITFEQHIEKLLEKEKEYAQIACERIKKDELWKKVTDSLGERKKLFLSLPEDERKELDFSVTSYSQVGFEIRKSYQINLNDKDKRAEKKQPNYYINLTRLRTARVLKSCGLELFKSGLIYSDIPPYQSKESLLENDFQDLVSRDSVELQKHDEEWIRISRNKENYSRATLEQLLSDAAINSSINSTKLSTLKRLWFPLHDIYAGGDKIFSREFDYEKFEEDNSKKLSDLKKSIIENRERQAKNDIKQRETSQKKKEREERISKINKGDIEVAQSCGEIGEGLIAKQEIVSNMLSLPLSRDAQQPYQKPTKNTYAAIGKLSSINTNRAITYDTNQLSGEGYAYILNFSNKTYWFNKNTSVGRNIYFVGQYIDNEELSFNQGQKKITARVYQVVCATAL